MHNAFKYHIDGFDADKIGERLTRIIIQEFGVTPERHEETAADDTIETTSGIESLPSLVLVIPDSVLDAVNLFDRLKKRKQLDALLDYSKRMLLQNSEIRIQIEKTDGTLISLNEVSSSDLLV